ncbi:MAG: hypothetical protein J5832_06040, partial [Clostridia bacterium]|nr:hypothetical protein [Clostridia bacterium]
ERLHFLNLISSIGTDKIILLSTHIIHDIENICPNVCILEKGNVMYSGKTTDMVETIKDKTWTATIKAGEESEIKKKAVVTNVTYTFGSPTVRYISDGSVYDGSTPATATLEDAYIYSVGGVAR